MIALPLPPARPGTWRGVFVERAEVGGIALHAVSTRHACGQPDRRNWFEQETTALAYAAEQADALDLPLFDFRDPGSD